MNGIVININPVIIDIGQLHIRWYGVFFALAIAAGVWLGLREARRKGLDGPRVEVLAGWTIVGGLVGARLFHVIDRWDLYASNLWRILDIPGGGLAVYGGLFGGVLTALLYALRHRLPVWRLADAAAPAMLLGQAVGRLACIPNGDALGNPTTLPWAFVYKNPHSMVPANLLGVPTQPYPAYEILLDLALFALIWRLRSVFKTDGVLFLTYAAAYSLGRFFLTYIRTERIWFWGLQEAQAIALLTFVLAIPLLTWRLRLARQPLNLRQATS